jgi:hypothetical protein
VFTAEERKALFSLVSLATDAIKLAVFEDAKKDWTVFEAYVRKILQGL